MQSLFQAVLISSILSIFFSIVAGMGDPKKTSYLSQTLMALGLVLLAVWFIQRLIANINRPDPEEEVRERLKQRELERQNSEIMENE